MYGGKDVEINNAIGRTMLGVLPESAESVTVNAEVLEDWAKVKFEFHDAAGTRGTFSIKDYPKKASSEIGNALIDLRNVMAGVDAQPWAGVILTVTRAGQFSTAFSYD